MACKLKLAIEEIDIVLNTVGNKLSADVVEQLEVAKEGIQKILKEAPGNTIQRENVAGIGNVNVDIGTVYGDLVVGTNELRVVETLDGMTLSQITAEAVDRLVKMKFDLEDTLSNKLLENVYKNERGKLYPFTAKGRLLSKGKESIFGKLEKFSEATPEEVVEVLPESFKEFFGVEDETAKGILDDIAILQDWMKKIPGVNESMLAHDSTFSITAEGLPKIKTLQEKDGKDVTDTEIFVNSLMLILGKEKTNVKKEVTNKQGKKVITTLNKIVVPEQMNEAVKFFVAKLAVDMQALASEIITMDDNELGKIVSYDEIDTARAMATKGYAPISVIRGTIAKDLYMSLGIKVNNGPAITEDAFIAGLGALVHQVAVKSGIIEEVTSKNKEEGISGIYYTKPKEPITREQVASMNRMQYVTESRSRTLPILKGKLKPTSNRKVKNSVYDVSPEANAFMNQEESKLHKLSANLDKWIELAEVDERAVLIANGWIDVDVLTDSAYVNSLVKSVDKGTLKKYEQTIENASYNEDTDIKLYTSEELQKIRAVNMKIEREWDLLKMFYGRLKGKEFHLPWGQTVSNRYTLLSDLNYQESKMHREFVREIGDEVEIDPAEDITKENPMFIAAVLQALDMKADKISNETGIKLFNELYNENKEEHKLIRDAVDAYKVWLNGGEAPKPYIIAQIFKNSEGNHGVSAIEALAKMEIAKEKGEKARIDMKVESDAITSGMILTLLQLGIDSALTLAEKGGIYTEEAKAMWSEYVEKHLGKGTVFTAGALIEAGKVHAQKIEKAAEAAKTPEEKAKILKEIADESVFKDIYETVGIKMVDTVKEYKNKLLSKGIVTTDAKATTSKLHKYNDKYYEDINTVRQLKLLDAIGELSLKNVRNIAKSPVMVFVYGASLGSIKKNLARSLGVETLRKLIKEGTQKDLDFVDMYTGKGTKYVDSEGKYLTYETVNKWSQRKRLLHLDMESIIDTINYDISSSFGSAIEKAFKETFPDVNNLRSLTKSVELLTFEVFNVRLEEKVKAAIAKKYPNGTKGYTEGINLLNNDEIAGLYADLIAEESGHDSIWYNSDGSIKNIQPLSKTDSATTDKVAGIAAIVKEALDNRTAKIVSKKEIANTGAAPTITIHGIDGELQRLLFTAIKEGGNIYDARIMKLSKQIMESGNTNYNENTVNVGLSRSVLTDNLTKLDKMLEMLSEEQLATLKDNLTKNKSSGLRNDLNRLKIQFRSDKALRTVLGAESKGPEGVSELLSWYSDSMLEKKSLEGTTLWSNHTHILFTEPTKVVVKKGTIKDVGNLDRINDVIDSIIEYEHDITLRPNEIVAITGLLRGNDKLKTWAIKKAEEHGIDIKGCF